MAKGTRMTIDLALAAEGTDRRVVGVRRNRVSAKIGVVILPKHSDPRRGDTITRVISIGRSEPDPAVFQILSENVVDDSGAQFLPQ